MNAMTENTFSTTGSLMKKSLIALSMASVLTFAAATDALADNHGKSKPGQCGETKLTEQMKDMKDHLQAYKKASESGDWDAMKENREALMTLTLESKKELPYKAHGKPKAEQEKMQANYKKGMTRLESLLADLEAAELAKDSDGVKKMMKEIGGHTKKGHKAFKQDCDEE